MRRFSLPSLVLAVGMLGAGFGCTTAREDSPESFRAATQSTVLFSRYSYVETYALLLTRIKSCFDGPDRYIRNALYPHQNRGAIAVMEPASKSRPYILLVEMIPDADEDGAEVVLYSRSEAMLDKVHDWILGNGGC